MSAGSKIQWTNATWNPATGCTKVSPGCKNCYAERMASRLQAMGQAKYRGGFKPTFHPDELAVPLHWKKPRMVFVSSMGDLFHEDITDEQIAAVFGVMAACPQHTFQVLTKRAKRMARWFEWVRTQEWTAPHYEGPPLVPHPWYVVWGWMIDQNRGDRLMTRVALNPPYPWPLPNVWVGVTAEDQQRADERIPLLLKVPAAVRFASVEPMLSEIHLRDEWLYCSECNGGGKPWRECCGPRLDWVICGEESGNGARPVGVEAIRWLQDDCAESRTPFFLKQMYQGGQLVKEPSLDGRQYLEFPGGSTSQKVGETGGGK